MVESSIIFFQDREIARRGGDDGLRLSAEAQAELQHVPGVVGPAPLGELVAPGGVELRAAQAVGRVGGEELGDGAVAPDDLVARDLIARTLARRVHAEQARDTFHHDAAHLGDGETDERDTAGGRARRNRIADRLGAHPFGSGARLARAAPAQQQPCLPGLAGGSGERRELIGAGPHRPVVDEVGEEVGREISKEFVARFTRQAG